MYLMMAGENASKNWTARTEDSLVSSELDVVVTDQGDIRELVLGIEIPKHPSKVFRVGGPWQVKPIHSFIIIALSISQGK